MIVRTRQCRHRSRSLRSEAGSHKLSPFRRSLGASEVSKGSPRSELISASDEHGRLQPQGPDLANQITRYTDQEQCDKHAPTALAIPPPLPQLPLPLPRRLSNLFLQMVPTNPSGTTTNPPILTNHQSSPLSTCFTNSTIIPLDAPSSTTPPAKSPNPPLFPRSSDSDDTKNPTTHRRTCADCTKQFCLDYNLLICEKATEADVFTTCFQRDSTKDELVVFIFIFATVGLLVWAMVKPYVLKWREGRQGVGQRGEYAVLSGDGGR